MTSSSIDTPPSGRFSGDEHRFPIRVYYEDTDAGGVVYHANYLRFMERARSDMLYLLEIDQAGALKNGAGSYVVAHIILDFRRPARLGEALVVVSRVTEVGAASIAVHRRVMRDGEVVVDGRLTIAFVSPGGRPRRQPAAWLAAFRGMAGEDDAR